MIFYVKKFLEAFNLLKGYAKKHSEDVELQKIIACFGQSYGYTASGTDVIEKN